MDFYGDSMQMQKEQKNKNLIKGLIIAIVIVLLAVIAIGISIYYISIKSFKFYLDGAKINSKDTFLIQENGDIYVSILDFANLVGYEYKNGEYKYQYSETTDRCYISNGSETATYIADSNIIYKLVLDTAEATNESNYEYYQIDEPVKIINGKLYTTIDGISKGCNVSISYNSENNKITTYTLPYLVNAYQTGVEDSAIGEKEENFSNQKAILYDLLIVKNSSNLYGVNTLTGNVIIGKKYKSITFLEGTQEFLVQTQENKYGIISKTGITEIEPEYASIKQIEPEEGLYLVSNNGKYGVVNRDGEVVIYLEYEEIGIDETKFSVDKIENKYILYDECIPVKRNGKWGLLDKNGNKVLDIQYDGFGCTSKIPTGGNSLLLVPQYKAIVVKKDSGYGLFSSSGDELIPAVVDTTNMYSVITSGEIYYYLTYRGETMEIIGYLKDVLNIQPIN